MPKKFTAANTFFAAFLQLCRRKSSNNAHKCAKIYWYLFALIREATPPENTSTYIVAFWKILPKMPNKYCKTETAHEIKEITLYSKN